MKKNIVLLLTPLFFLLLYHQVFLADYAYLDEAYQLWNNRDQTNYNMFLTQGRWLTGLLFRSFFGAISAIEEIKYIRIFSFVGWVLTACLWLHFFRRWAAAARLDNYIPALAQVFLICSLPVAIYIGWASCFELFLGVAAAMTGGHILFTSLHRQQQGPVHLSGFIMMATVALGVASLFLYQTVFGVFLIPFFVYYIRQERLKPDRLIVIGLAFYLITHVVYFFLFKYSLQQDGVAASTRTGFNLNPVEKLSFFFSGPLPQAFALNILYSPRSIFAQLLYPLVAGFWITGVFLLNRARGFMDNLFHILIVLLFLALIYLPLMIASENFAPYRTMFALNMAVLVMVADALFRLLRTERARKLTAIAAAVVFIAVGFYNYNFQFVRPLKAEYSALHSFLQKNYHSGITEVHFIYPSKTIFTDIYGIRTARDEFGVPSTFRDWVPEPIVKQIITELTGDRKKAEALKVVQYEARPPLQPSAQQLVIDMNEVVRGPQSTVDGPQTRH